MIISHKLKCIYIRNLKVGGSSFELALSRYCGPDDIITPIGAEHLMVEKHSAQNCNDIKRDSKDRNRHPDYFHYTNAHGHMGALNIKNDIPQKLWNNYLKIAAIRCPYDMIISFYYFLKYVGSVPDNLSFGDYIDAPKKRDNIMSARFARIHIEGKLAPDFLIRYEHLDEDIKKLEDKIDCPGLLDKFKRINAKGNMRPKERTSPCEIYYKHPKAKLAIDKVCYKNQRKYEFLREYWPMYKAKLERDMDAFIEEKKMHRPQGHYIEEFKVKLAKFFYGS